MAKTFKLMVDKISVDPVYDKDNNLETYEVKGSLYQVVVDEIFNDDGSLNGTNTTKQPIQKFGARLTPFFVFSLPVNDGARKKAIGDEVLNIANAAIAAYEEAIADEIIKQKTRPKATAMDVIGFDKIDSSKLKTKKPV